MRALLLLAALPLVAGPSKGKPVNVKLTQAVVTSGAGVEPRGSASPAQVEAEVTVAGLKSPKGLEFRAWRLQAADLPALERGANLRFVRGGQGRLETTATPGPEGTWKVQGGWSGTPKAEDRLVVEVWRGTRRLGYAVAPLTEHLLQGGRPKAGEERP